MAITDKTKIKLINPEKFKVKVEKNRVILKHKDIKIEVFYCTIEYIENWLQEMEFIT